MNALKETEVELMINDRNLDISLQFKEREMPKLLRENDVGVSHEKVSVRYKG